MENEKKLSQITCEHSWNGTHPSLLSLRVTVKTLDLQQTNLLLNPDTRGGALNDLIPTIRNILESTMNLVAEEMGYEKGYELVDSITVERE